MRMHVSSVLVAMSVHVMHPSPPPPTHEMPSTYVDHYVQPHKVHKCSRRRVHPLHPETAVAAIGSAGGKAPSWLAMPLVAAECAPK